MTLTVGVLMDPISKINIKKDSTFALLLEAQQRNHQLIYLEDNDIFIENGKVRAEAKNLNVEDNEKHWFSCGATYTIDIEAIDILLMRKDPPFNMDYIYTTYLLEKAEQQGVFVVNAPKSLRDCNEKLYTTWFPEYCPPSLTTSQPKRIKTFIQEHKDVILKPLDGMGGTSIFRVKEGDANTNVIIETLTDYGHKLAMAQRFIPEITQGDKRILMVNGEPIPYCLARIPAQGETRGNLAAGGRGVVQPLSEADKKIADIVGPELKKRGLYFVGLDVIGSYLTEINVTSPTCIREIDAEKNTQIAAQLFNALETQYLATKK